VLAWLLAGVPPVTLAQPVIGDEINHGKRSYPFLMVHP
jgi:hypothetical protein